MILSWGSLKLPIVSAFVKPSVPVAVVHVQAPVQALPSTVIHWLVAPAARTPSVKRLARNGSHPTLDVYTPIAAWFISATFWPASVLNSLFVSKITKSLSTYSAATFCQNVLKSEADVKTSP